MTRQKRPSYHLLLSVLLLTAVLWFSACQRQQVYYHYEHTPMSGWEKNDTLLFDIDALAEGGTYRQYIGLRIDQQYPFRRLCLVVQQTILPSGVSRSDTIDNELIDKQGRPKGSGVSYYQYEFPYNTLTLEPGDSLHISIRHHMKREIMVGIKDVGIKLVREVH
ncbi:MAG: gliding motility lipoprotein GldH [Prevotella sp.]|nr:gliding motility lipoprotein GldH [Prevotella sp.]